MIRPIHIFISHSLTPSSIISPHPLLTAETLVLDIRKQAFNYPWPHISLKYLHCTAPQGDTADDLSPNLFMCHLLGRDLWHQCLQYVYILLLNHGRLKLWCLLQDVLVSLRPSSGKTWLVSLSQLGLLPATKKTHISSKVPTDIRFASVFQSVSY